MSSTECVSREDIKRYVWDRRRRVDDAERLRNELQGDFEMLRNLSESLDCFDGFRKKLGLSALERPKEIFISFEGHERNWINDCNSFRAALSDDFAADLDAALRAEVERLEERITMEVQKDIGM